MFQKKDYVFGAILVYLFLIMMAFVVKKEKFISYCNYEKLCIRFCCEVFGCDEEIIRKHFNESLTKNYDYDNYDDEEEENKTVAEKYKILLGQPKCSLKTISLYGSDKWSFNNEGVQVNGLYYSSDQYCMKYKQVEGKVSWDLLACPNRENLHQNLHFVLMLISVLFLAASVVVYASLKELRTVSGRIFLFFALSILIVYFAYPMMRFRHFIRGYSEYIYIALFIGSLNSYFWMSIMSFDIWWTFRKFRVTTNGPFRLKLYYACIVGCWLLLILSGFKRSVRILRHLFDLLLFGFYAIALFDIFFLIHTSTMIYRMKRGSDVMENSRFSDEKKRFWMYVQLYIIAIVTLPLELYSLQFSRDPYEFMIICDIVKFVSAIAIFCIFVMKKSVRMQLLQCFGSLRNPSGVDQLMPESP